MWRKVLGPFREFGWSVGLLYAFDRVLRRLSRHLSLVVYELMEQPTAAVPRLPERLARNLCVRELSQASPEVAAMPALPHIKVKRFEQGARCVGVFRREVLLGYAWFCRGRYEEDEVRCTFVLPDRAGFDFDLVVQPEHRMGLGFVSVWHGFADFLAASGIDVTYSRITRFNLASRRAHQRLGSRVVGRVVFLRAWRFQAMVGDCAPYLDLSLRRPVRLPMPSAGSQQQRA